MKRSTIDKFNKAEDDFDRFDDTLTGRLHDSVGEPSLDMLSPEERRRAAKLHKKKVTRARAMKWVVFANKSRGK